MPIGDQQTAGQVTTSVDLRKRYDLLIKEALLRADPELDVTRADDVAMPGTITSDILTRLMHSEIVVADLTYPNPNVFYELGLRHACRTGTILIRDKTGPALPFDLSHQRYIEYENTPSGLKELSETFKQCFDFFSRNHSQPDNHFLELAKLTCYAYPRYEEPAQEKPEVTVIKAIMQSPELIDLFTRERPGGEVDQKEIIAALGRNPEVAGVFAQALAASGNLSFTPPAAEPAAVNRAQRRAETAKARKGKQ